MELIRILEIMGQDNSTTIRIFIIIILLLLGALILIMNGISSDNKEYVPNHCVINFYDDFGTNILSIDGNKICLEACCSYADSPTNLVTLSMDGCIISQASNTFIVVSDGIQSINSFNISAISDVANISSTQNISKLVLIYTNSQVPIAVFGGQSIHTENLENLPETTKVIIDGLSLYIHKAHYLIVNSNE